VNTKLWCATVCAVAISLCVAAAARAEIKFDRANYDALAEASSPEGIPEGTRITLQNWQQYKRFMPIGMQALFSQQYPWKIGSGPEFAMEVGPTIPVPLAKRLAQDTEKYAGQTKLRKVETGGYTAEGYVAGIPFPEPAGEQMAYQILYNVFYGYIPPVYRYVTKAHLVDRFLNDHPQRTEVTLWRLNHLSADGMPVTPDYGKGYLQAARFFILSPEQTRYTTQLALQPDDPQKVQEIYVFLPSLRRSLRLSSAARCSPILGTDWVQDDNSDGFAFQIPKFAATFLGERKILAMVHARNPERYDDRNYLIKSSAPGWPTSKVGQWELRDVYVVDVSPLPGAGPYCYGHKVVYIDKQTWTQLGFDFYDNNQRLWKMNLIPMGPLKIDTGEETLFHSANVDIMWDLQNQHATISVVESHPQFGNDVPKDLRDAATWAFPGSLSHIMR
jgi:hypothetical protein